MNHYMVDMDLSEDLDEAFYALIPEQREIINELMESGIVLSYALALDRSKLWATVAAESEEEVLAIVTEFPIYEYIEATVYELAFLESTNFNIPQFSLN